MPSLFSLLNPDENLDTGKLNPTMVKYEKSAFHLNICNSSVPHISFNSNC